MSQWEVLGTACHTFRLCVLDQRLLGPDPTLAALPFSLTVSGQFAAHTVLRLSVISLESLSSKAAFYSYS